VKSNQNIIHSSTFNFEFENRVAAVRCNNLIESIFNSHILPELEKAISNQIPEGMLVELSKLEINIGKISEKELSAHLAKRISESLENALKNYNPMQRNPSDGRQILSNYILKSIEAFLQYGYLPGFTVENTLIDELFIEAIKKNKSEFITILEKYATNENALRRIVNNLKPETFDEILWTLIPVESNWIIDFRRILLHTRKDNNRGQFTGNEFLSAINVIILKYILKRTSSDFDRKDFSSSIIKELFTTPTDFSILFEKVKKFTSNTTAIIVLNETLAELNVDLSDTQTGTKVNEIDINKLIELLNSGNDGSEILKSHFLKNEIILAIRNQEKRKQLLEKLNKIGVNLILELFYGQDPFILINLITSFSEKVVTKTSDITLNKTTIALNNLVLFTAIYLNEKSFRSFNNEEFILFLIYSAGLNPSKTIKSLPFLSFVRTEGNFDLSKLKNTLAEEQHYPEISVIQKSISKNTFQRTEKDFSSVITKDFEYYSIFSRKIIGYYLETGQLQSTYQSLNLLDVQTLFHDLILQKEDFLCIQFRNNKDPESLIHRINTLAINIPAEDLKAYFIHYFHVEYAILYKVTSELEQYLSARNKSHLNTAHFENDMLIRALAKSKGGSLAGIFELTILELLNQEFGEDSVDSEKIIHYFISASGGNPEFEDWKKKIQSSSESKNRFRKDFNRLIQSLDISDIETPTSAEMKYLIHKIAFYFQIDQTTFIDILQKNKAYILRIYTLLKLHIPQSQWNPIEKSLLSIVGIKEEIEAFQSLVNTGLSNKSKSDFDFIETFETISQLQQEKQKAFFLLLASDKVMFEKFISQVKDFSLPENLKFHSKQVQAYLQQLISYSPKVASVKIDQNFWKSIVISFAIRIFPDEKKFDSISFAKAFTSHLIQKLKATNELEMFYPVLDQLSTSGSKVLKELVENSQISKAKKTFKPAEFLGQDTTKKVPNYFSLLRFYAQNGFFPWWAEKTSFPEIFIELGKSYQENPENLKDIFLQIEKEKPLFERLTLTLPRSLADEFNWLFYKQAGLKPNNEKTDQKNENHDNLKFIESKDLKDNTLIKELYFSDLETIIKYWSKSDPQIAMQIQEYWLLSPYFNFRQVDPAKWRQLVSEFSGDFYGTGKKTVNPEFHIEFLNYLKNKISSINWNETLTTVYQRVSAIQKSTLVFPEGLKKLIEVQSTNQASSKELELDGYNLAGTDLEGVEVKIYNSGLILFWPFLTRLFEHLSLLKNGSFTNQESKNRAVYLLQYLVYFDIDFPEYKLVLNKLLVGMSTQEHLTPLISLTEDEKDSAHSLLNGLINNWEKVKNASPQGIQETFLQREGILRFQSERVTLVVEKKGVDILLESIPWNISLIKLAWMKVPIYVEWI